jgi:hypothetical protein
VEWHFLSRFQQFVYLILDPFNYTYTPAKNINQLSQFYPYVFKQGLD